MSKTRFVFFCIECHSLNICYFCVIPLLPKNRISYKIFLTHLNPALSIKVSADASNSGIGACLSHIYPDGTEKAIAHISRTLNDAEKSYSQIVKEGLK